MSSTLPDADLFDGPGIDDEESYQNALRRAKVEREFWDAHRAKYRELYPDEFIAVLDGKVIAHDEDLLSLRQTLKSLGYELHEVFVEFMRTAKRPFLL